MSRKLIYEQSEKSRKYTPAQIKALAEKRYNDLKNRYGRKVQLTKSKGVYRIYQLD